MARQIIVIHGRATKPREKEKFKLVRKSLLNGLRRADESSAEKIESGEVKLKLAYYGDINNALMWASKQKPKKKVVADFLTKWPYKYEKNGSYDADLETLLARPTSKQNKSAYRKLLAEHKDMRYLDEIADIVSPIARLFGLNDKLINAVLPDLAAYFEYRTVGSMVRERLQSILVPALESGDEICLIGHSMGSIVAYDVLWKLSRMSEYKRVRDKKISLFITLGSPLGEESVSKQLYDSHEPDDGRYPSNIIEWQNFTATDDFVARDEDLADDFYEMQKKGLTKRIKDREIYTFWVGSHGTNPHKLYGYLDNHKVASTVAKWIRSA